MIEIDHEHEKCPECKSTHININKQRGETVCNDCGLILSDRAIDYDQEWRAFDQEQRNKRERTGKPTSLTRHDKGLPTEIGWQNRDSSGKPIPQANRAQIDRIRKWQRRMRISNATERNLVFALSEIDRIASRMGLPRTVHETAAMIYRSSVKRNLIRGRSIEGVAAASLYAACRQCGVPRTLDEIAMEAHVNRKEIGRTYRFVARELGLKITPTNPADYIPRFASQLKLSMEVQRKAIEIIQQASAKELASGRGPMGLAAAALYIAAILLGERRTQRSISSVASVTEVTIRNRYSSLIKELNIDIII